MLTIMKAVTSQLESVVSLWILCYRPIFWGDKRGVWLTKPSKQASMTAKIHISLRVRHHQNE
jgi:hypothetical protein